MACSCHGKRGEIVKVARFDDQCTMCARKHVKNAWGAWGEFTYEEDNRDYVSDQLRKAADHLKFSHRDTALKCRDLAVAIEMNKERDYADFAAELDSLRAETRSLFYADHPDALLRLKDMRDTQPE